MAASGIDEPQGCDVIPNEQLAQQIQWDQLVTAFPEQLRQLLELDRHEPLHVLDLDPHQRAQATALMEHASSTLFRLKRFGADAKRNLQRLMLAAMLFGAQFVASGQGVAAAPEQDVGMGMRLFEMIVPVKTNVLSGGPFESYVYGDATVLVWFEAKTESGDMRFPCEAVVTTNTAEGAIPRVDAARCFVMSYNSQIEKPQLTAKMGPVESDLWLKDIILWGHTRQATGTFGLKAPYIFDEGSFRAYDVAPNQASYQTKLGLMDYLGGGSNRNIDLMFAISKNWDYAKSIDQFDAIFADHLRAISAGGDICLLPLQLEIVD